MSDKAGKDEGGEKKGKGKLGLIIIGVAMLAVGGGGAFAAMMFMGGGGHEEHKEAGPQLVRKGEADPYAPPAGEGEEGALPEIESIGGDEFRTAYYTFPDEFTSNLKDSDALVQTALAASTRRDGRVLRWMAQHELAIRSRLLEILADTPEEQVYTIEGKDKLQKRMTKAINDVLKEKEGYGGIDAIYFRSFIIQ